jgi:hypothetical protein
MEDRVASRVRRKSFHQTKRKQNNISITRNSEKPKKLMLQEIWVRTGHQLQTIESSIWNPCWSSSPKRPKKMGFLNKLTQAENRK